MHEEEQNSTEITREAPNCYRDFARSGAVSAPARKSRAKTRDRRSAVQELISQ